MATQQSRAVARLMISPSVILLVGWMIIPLGMTLYFSTLHYNLLIPGPTPSVGFENYTFFFHDPAFQAAVINTLLLVGGVLIVTLSGGVLLASLADSDDCAVLRHANSFSIGLEEHVYEPSQWTAGSSANEPGLSTV